MAKQTFTTGQVLTAAQMTSLQQTAMGGGAATAKTANYVLVAADAGTTVAMNAAGATTITVNTGLFAAGDTVFIQNLGAGACTVTAGTATVATAGSLILPQNDAGILYFTSASAAIFYDYIQAGAVSPLTTKGDLYTFSTSDARLGVGANGTTLVADSSQSTGLKWQTPTAAGANWSLLNSGGTTLTGSTTTVSGISGADKIMVLVVGASTNSTQDTLNIRFNGDSGNNYAQIGSEFAWPASYDFNNYTTTTGLTNTSAYIGRMSKSSGSGVSGFLLATGCNSSGLKVFNLHGMASPDADNSQRSYTAGGYYNSASTISSVSFTGGTFDAGTVYIYTSA